MEQVILVSALENKHKANQFLIGIIHNPEETHQNLERTGVPERWSPSQQGPVRLRLVPTGWQIAAPGDTPRWVSSI